MDKRLKETWESCVKCGICRSVCPVFKEEKNEAYVARGHITLLSELVKGNIDFKEETAKDYLYKCLLCTTCVEACPNNSQTDLIVEIARHEVIKKHGLATYKKIMAKVLKSRTLMDFTFKSANFFSGVVFSKTQLPRESLVSRFNTKPLPKGKTLPHLSKKTFLEKYATNKKKASVAVFPGCLINYTYTEIGDAFIRILNRLNIGYLVDPKQLCCGAPVYFSGNFKDAAYLARANIKRFEELDVDFIIVLEPTCASTIKHDYEKLFIYLKESKWEERAKNISKKIIDPVKFLYDHTDLLKKMGRLNIKTTYHDPCHLKRTQKIKDEPRAFLKQSTLFKEMKEADRCCGNGGTFSIDYPDTSFKIATRKLNNILNSNADHLITGCSACIMQLSDMLKRNGHENIRVLHTVEIIDMAMEANYVKKG
ncbi:(Fe-S)-binding protein [Hippea jasoniae]|uniref:(Fe-S)-binding protein n=1 Tax=Hippea jasoniae TaxID=944479 RepID=UPI000553F733|nr:(Fe-S)-binding protein [Hippea jasoniae]